MKTVLAIDTGGTFTDFLLFEKGDITAYKIPSTPEDPSIAVINGIEHLTKKDQAKDIIHGSTVATNALLEGKTAKAVLIATQGFEDVIEIGRGNRLELYNFNVDSKPVLVPDKLRFPLSERINKDGEVVINLQEKDIEELCDKLSSDKSIESIAVSFLFSYKNPIHEQKVKEHLKKLNIPISLSSDILPEYREYERTTTTVVNALVSPIMTRYLGNIESNIENSNIRIMQSNGGSISVRKAKENAVHTILSGPAGGVVGAFELSKLSGINKIITFDMGGTSTDVSLCNEGIKSSNESSINHVPIKVPILDIHTIGAGGGSIAFIDEGGSLNVGPISSGADPGPICYGKGDRITVTDAHLYLGRLEPDYFLGGEMKLFPDRLTEPFKAMAKDLKLSERELAEGIIQIANQKMGQAIRLVSVEKGYDPKDFALVSFGGAGGLHACDLMNQLNIPKLLIPKNPGLLSAMGMLLSDVIKDYSKTVLIPSDEMTFEEWDKQYTPLEGKAVSSMLEEGFSENEIILEKYIDLRYIGQSFELLLPFTKDFIQKFHQEHQRQYGYCDPQKATEGVTIRLKAIGITSKPAMKKSNAKVNSTEALSIREKEMIIDGITYNTKLYNRDDLRFGHEIKGPAIIVEYSSTTVLAPQNSAYVDEYETLFISNK